MNPIKRKSNLIVIWIVIIILLSGLGINVNANPISDSKVILTSRFILWDKYEKMIDNNFTLHLFYNNNTINNTAYYNITLDEYYYSGFIDTYKSFDFNFSNREIIMKITVKIENQTVFSANEIIIVEGITQSHVKRGISEFLISLNPLEWKSKEWNIFYAVIIASLISIVIALRMVRYYKIKKGVTEIK